MTDIRPFIARVGKTLEAHRNQETRSYSRMLASSSAETEGMNDVYGTADAAIITYTLNEMPTDARGGNEWIAALQQFQEADSGVFAGLGHNEIHSTAFALSALELFDGKPLYPLAKFEKLMDTNEITAFLESLDWRNQPWGESLKGAGIYACMVLSESVPQEWEQVYFDWLHENADPLTGLWRKGCVKHEDGCLAGAPLFHHVAGTFHYLFNLSHRQQPIRYPERIIDTCLELYRNGELDLPIEPLNYFHIDWVYTFRCCMKQTSYRRAECEAAIRGTSKPFIEALARLGKESDDSFDDLHSLCGAICGLAVIQQLLPDLVQTKKPLQLVLDRRPFI